MARKRNNNLIMIKHENGDKMYYTSTTQVGYKLGIANASVLWALEHNNTLTDNCGNKLSISLVDGSEVKWKEINNT
jgi:hypothetical protein